MNSVNIRIGIPSNTDVNYVKELLKTAIEQTSFNYGLSLDIEFGEASRLVGSTPEQCTAYAVGDMVFDSEEYRKYIYGLVGQAEVIKAIKEVRTKSGWGLRESKDYVDRLRSGELPLASTVRE